MGVSLLPERVGDSWNSGGSGRGLLHGLVCSSSSKDLITFRKGFYWTPFVVNHCDFKPFLFDVVSHLNKALQR